jgi:hypothetical protein
MFRRMVTPYIVMFIFWLAILVPHQISFVWQHDLSEIRRSSTRSMFIACRNKRAYNHFSTHVADMLREIYYDITILYKSPLGSYNFCSA